MLKAPDLVCDFALRCGYRFVLTEATHPADWLQGSEYAYETKFDGGDTPDGVYDLAVAIVNTELENKPEIALAIRGELPGRRWYRIGIVTILPPDMT